MGDERGSLRAIVAGVDAGLSDEDACLEWLKDRLYPEGIHCVVCARVTRHHRVASRRSYSCQHCGHHVHPTAGTIFHGSSTPLAVWFRAVVLLRESDGRLPVKELERNSASPTRPPGAWPTAFARFSKTRAPHLPPGDTQSGSYLLLGDTQDEPDDLSYTRAAMVTASGRHSEAPSRFKGR
jgi:hypothetical protein